MVKVRWVLMHPSDFFEKRQFETHIREAALYLITLTFVSSILSSLLNLAVGANQLSLMRKFFYLNLPLPGSAPLKLALLSVVYSILLIFFSYAVAFLLKLWMHLFLVHTPYSKSYQLLAYAVTPIYLFGWISEYVSYATWVWALILLVLGCRNMFGASRKKAWLMFTLPALLFVLGSFVVGSWIASIFSG